MTPFLKHALSCLLCVGADSMGSTNRIGEKLVLLKSGEAGQGGLISYGLYSVASGSRAGAKLPPGNDLILILRNNGAKWIDFEHVTAESFSLRDSQGRDIKIYLHGSVQGISYGDSQVIHLVVESQEKAAQPWALRFKSPPGAFVPVELSITGIEPELAHARSAR